MYVNVGGRVDLLFTAISCAVVTSDPFVPENLIWIMKQDNRLLLVTHPKNQASADDLAKRHNEIYDSPLAQALREN